MRQRAGNRRTQIWQKGIHIRKKLWWLVMVDAGRLVFWSVTVRDISQKYVALEARLSRYMANTYFSEICSNCIRELHHVPNTSADGQDTRVGVVGYCRTRGIWSSPSIIIPGDRFVVCLFRDRLPKFPRECYGQGKMRKGVLVRSIHHTNWLDSGIPKCYTFVHTHLSSSSV